MVKELLLMDKATGQFNSFGLKYYFFVAKLLLFDFKYAQYQQI